MTADTILAIPLANPEKLFIDPSIAPKKYRELVKRWHPDHVNGDEKVAAHVNALWLVAKQRIKDGTWNDPNVLFITTTEARTYRFRFLRAHPFELGTMLVANRVVLFMLDHKHEDLLISGLRGIGSVKYPNANMREQHQRFIPVVEKCLSTGTHDTIAIRKTSDVILLRDLIDHFGGALDPKHVAWIISSLLNIVCFYYVIGLTHNGLSPDTVFVSPQFHTAYPLGGWWYSLPAGKQIKFLPPSSHVLTPRKMLISKKASSQLDIECIKAIGRACLGDVTGTSLRSKPGLPPPMVAFLNLPGSSEPIDCYEEWFDKVLVASFGARRFTKLEINPGDIYS